MDRVKGVSIIFIVTMMPLIFFTLKTIKKQNNAINKCLIVCAKEGFPEYKYVRISNTCICKKTNEAKVIELN